MAIIWPYQIIWKWRWYFYFNWSKNCWKFISQLLRYLPTPKSCYQASTNITFQIWLAWGKMFLCFITFCVWNLSNKNYQTEPNKQNPTNKTSQRCQNKPIKPNQTKPTKLIETNLSNWTNQQGFVSSHVQYLWPLALPYQEWFCYVKELAWFC